MDVADRRLLVEATIADDDGLPTIRGPGRASLGVGAGGRRRSLLVLVAPPAAARRPSGWRRLAAAQVRLIGEVAPLVQQSLELAEVLPSVAVQLSDHFELAGVALSTGIEPRRARPSCSASGVDPDPR